MHLVADIMVQLLILRGTLTKNEIYRYSDTIVVLC